MGMTVSQEKAIFHNQYMVKFLLNILKKYFTTKYKLGALDTLSKFSAIFAKGDNICDLLFPLLQAKSLLKRGLV